MIDSDQVDVANDVFAPTAEQAARAEEIVDRYQRADQAAITTIDGNVIEKKCTKWPNACSRRPKRPVFAEVSLLHFAFCSHK